jgi:hypothetical protein
VRLQHLEIVVDRLAQMLTQAKDFQSGVHRTTRSGVAADDEHKRIGFHAKALRQLPYLLESQCTGPDRLQQASDVKIARLSVLSAETPLVPVAAGASVIGSKCLPRRGAEVPVGEWLS